MRPDDLTPIGITNFRNTNQPFGIKDDDRLGHLYIIGKTGVGKSTLIKNMAISDITRGKGLCVIDPHGDLSRELIKAIPESRKKDLIYFNPKDIDQVIAFNPLNGIPAKYHHLVASGLISTFKKIWIDSWGPRLEYILRYSILTLLWLPEATILDIQPLLTEKVFRNRVMEYVQESHILAFWEKEFENYSAKLRSEAVSSILNKTGLFLSSLPLRKIFGQVRNNLKLQPVLDDGKILIVNLSKGEIGEDASTILGSVLINSLQLAVMHRATQEEIKRKPFFLYIDECHSYLTLSIANILSEARKYKLSLCLANQFIRQLSEPIRESIFGNVGTLISFRVGSDDATFLEKEFAPVFNEMDLINLPRYSMYLKLMIDGTTSIPFSAIFSQIPPVTYENESGGQ